MEINKSVFRLSIDKLIKNRLGKDYLKEAGTGGYYKAAKYFWVRVLIITYHIQKWSVISYFC